MGGTPDGNFIGNSSAQLASGAFGGGVQGKNPVLAIFWQSRLFLAGGTHGALLGMGRGKWGRVSGKNQAKKSLFSRGKDESVVERASSCAMFGAAFPVAG